jgi:glutamate-1-semialdehyde 2,1-aminomutase
VLAEPGVFAAIAMTTQEVVDGLCAAAADAGVPLQAGGAGTMFGFYFLKEAGTRITDWDSAKAHADTARYGRFFHRMLERGVYFAPSQFEAAFMSVAHGPEEIDATLAAAREVMASL